MKTVKFLGFFALTAVMLFGMTACGSGKTTIVVYNWSGYIDDEICRDFEEETGIRVKYDTFATNEDMYTMVRKNEGVYDVLMPSEYMIERMINEGMLEKLDKSNIPNAANIDPRFQNLRCDPDNEYLVTYMWGTVGLMYNKERVTETVDSWEILWNEKYKGKIFMLDSTRDAIGITLRLLGYSLNSTDLKQINEAKQKLIEQKPLTLAYVGDTVKDKMIGNEGDIAVVYSGDAIFCQSLNPNIDYAIPKEGSNIWFDGMVIPKGAKNKKEAEMFIDYMSRAEIGAKQSEKIGYTTTNRASLEYIDDSIKSNPIYWPADEVLENCEMFIDLGEYKKAYDEAWNDILIGQ